MKRQGIVECYFVKLWPHFIDAISAKDRRKITFQLKYPPSDKLKAWIEEAIQKNFYLYILAEEHPDEDMYWFLRMANGGAKYKRAKVMQRIAYDNLMKEVAKDFNPANVKKSTVSHIRRSDYEFSSTSGKVGGSLLRHIKRPNQEEFVKLHKTRRKRLLERHKAWAHIEAIKDRYRTWRRKNYGTMEEFIAVYRLRGEAQEKAVILYFSYLEIKQRLDQEEKRWRELKKDFL